MAQHMLSSQHSQNVEPLLANVPGLKVISVATPADGKGLLKSAIRDENPVVFLESEMLYGMKGEVPDSEDFLIPIGQADVKREGSDVTMVTWGKITHEALRAADELATRGTAVEVIDLRSLVPMDEQTVFKSVRKPGGASSLRKTGLLHRLVHRFPTVSKWSASTTWMPQLCGLARNPCQFHMQRILKN